MDHLQIALKRYFGFDSFRPMQEEVVRHLMSGGDALVLMPTGGGKSVCFQIPALLMEGTAVVISPLISLMKDQVDMLRANGIPAAALNSSLTSDEQMQTRRQCREGTLKLLYLSPERLKVDLAWIKSVMKVSLIVVDEAHCISAWGHDFRPEYTQLQSLHDDFPGVPIAAFTATADKVTRADIREQLRLRGEGLFISSFDRPNLSLSVRTGCSAREKLAQILGIIDRNSEGSGIIYCMTRKMTEELSESLQHKGISCAAYHAGMEADARRKVQEDFKCDRVRVVCATIAFGMGIDKQDVRFVVHYNLPGSMESFYQEIGRGGRDGMPCETLLFYNLQDVVMRRRFAEESELRDLNILKLRQMQQYAESPVGRRRVLLNYFGEVVSHDCKNCDVCAHPPRRFDGTEVVQKLLSAVVRCGESVGGGTIVDVLRGEHSPTVQRRGFDHLKTFGAGADFTREQWNGFLLQMIHLGFVEVDVLHYRTLKMTALGNEVLRGRMKAELSVPVQPEIRVRRSKPVQDTTPLQEADKLLFQALRKLRLALAQEASLPAYMILSDKSLQSIASRKPRTLLQLGDCFGVGEAKKDKYGERILECINTWEQKG